MLTLYRYLEKIWFCCPQKIRYILVGGFNTVFSYGLFVLMVAGLNISYKTAIIVGFVIATNVSIFTMRYYVFCSTGRLIDEYTKAWGVYLALCLVNYVAMWLMVDYLRINALLAQAGYTIIGAIITYLAHRYISFRPPK